MEIGENWRGWTIEKRIGEGSFGKVYKIFRNDAGVRREAALKVIEIPVNQSELKSIYNEGMSEQEIRDYFNSVMEGVVNEYELMYQLKGHPNVVNYMEHQVVRKQYEIGWVIYIQMELLTGIFDFIQSRREKGLQKTEILQLGIDMCKALEACQQHNIIHRDIKPENIFVAPDGSFKLGDFGVARKLEQTMSGLSQKGTYSYMAPEVYQGRKYNSSVDIYSLGIVMYRLLNNNRIPFLPPPPNPIKYADREKALSRRMDGEEIPPPYYADKELSGIILKACAYLPQDRYRNAIDMRRDLEKYLIHLSNIEMAKQVELQKRQMEQQRQQAELQKRQMEQQRQQEELQKRQIEQQRQQAELQKSQTEQQRQQSELQKQQTEQQKQQEEQQKQEISRNDSSERRFQETVAYSSNQATEKKNGKKKKKKNFAGIICGVAVFVGIISIGIINLVNASQKCMVPDMINMDYSQAEELAEEDGLVLVESSEQEFSDTVGEGRIISQDIHEGTKVEKGTTIVVTVSKGKRILVPKVVGTTEKSAREMAESVGLSIIVQESVYSEKEKGIVLWQSPNADEEAKEGDVIHVKVSLGAEQVEVPALSGLTEKEAKKLVAESGLEYKVALEEYSDTVTKGSIISQTPGSQTMADKGATISVVVSKGEEKAEVPLVVGKSRDEAKKALKEVGLKYDIKEAYDNDVEEGYVISQETEAGEKVKKNTKIEITVSLGKKPEEKKTSDSGSSSSGSTQNNNTQQSQPQQPQQPQQSQPQQSEPQPQPQPQPEPQQPSQTEEYGMDWGDSFVDQ